MMSVSGYSRRRGDTKAGATPARAATVRDSFSSNREQVHRFTLEIPVEVFRELKMVVALEDGLSIRDVLLEGVEVMLDRYAENGQFKRLR